MAITRVHFKWYDGFFLSMLAFSIVMVLLSWKRYYLCKFPLHMWIVIDYAVVFVFRILMFVDSGLADKMGLDYGRQQRDAYFLGRLVVLSILYMVLYPFLWAWSITGSIWFTSAHTCLPEKNQKWGFLVWLIFSYGGLICLAIYLVNKWLTRRKVHLERAQLGITVSRISEYRVLVDMIRLPDRVFENAADEMRAMEHDAVQHHPGLYLSETQRQAVEALIHELPLFSLKAIPSDCSDCPICLEEFRVGDEVRGLPCAHNFHLACIDKWLSLNIKCPRCRCSIFPSLELNDFPNIPPDPNRSSTSHHAQSQSYLARMQSFLMPLRTENIASSNSNSNSNSNFDSSSNFNLDTIFTNNNHSDSSSNFNLDSIFTNNNDNDSDVTLENFNLDSIFTNNNDNDSDVTLENFNLDSIFTNNNDNDSDVSLENFNLDSIFMNSNDNDSDVSLENFNLDSIFTNSNDNDSDVSLENFNLDSIFTNNNNNDDSDVTLEMAENGGQPSESHGHARVENMEVNHPRVMVNARVENMEVNHPRVMVNTRVKSNHPRVMVNI